MPAARPWSRCGILSWFVPPALAGEVAREAAAERDAALAAAGEKVPRRRARLLPPSLAVYFTLALCLLADLPYQEALRSLAGDGAAGLAGPATTALTAARRRLGERPLELLFWRVAGVLLPSRDPWATVGGLLVTAWDGTTLKVPATLENAAAFGRPRHGGGRKAPAAGKKEKDGKAPPREGHYPQMRVVALIACGTRALLGAAIGPLADGEQKLAATLTGCLRPGMLLLADRGFWSHFVTARGTADGFERGTAQPARQDRDSLSHGESVLCREMLIRALAVEVEHSPAGTVGGERERQAVPQSGGTGDLRPEPVAGQVAAGAHARRGESAFGQRRKVARRGPRLVQQPLVPSDHRIVRNDPGREPRCGVDAGPAHRAEADDPAQFVHGGPLELDTRHARPSQPLDRGSSTRGS
jgi:hypothetical protein